MLVGAFDLSVFVAPLVACTLARFGAVIAGRPAAAAGHHDRVTGLRPRRLRKDIAALDAPDKPVVLVEC